VERGDERVGSKRLAGKWKTEKRMPQRAGLKRYVMERAGGKKEYRPERLCGKSRRKRVGGGRVDGKVQAGKDRQKLVGKKGQEGKARKGSQKW
jgi:hypothetical protein